MLIRNPTIGMKWGPYGYVNPLTGFVWGGFQPEMGLLYFSGMEYVYHTYLYRVRLIQ